MKTKTYFCSDTHFNHPNILKYEPKRIDAIIEHIQEMGEVDELIPKLDSINKKYDLSFSYTLMEEYNTKFGLTGDDDTTWLKDLFNSILNNEEYSSEDEEENKNLKSLQKELIKVILDYQTEMMIDRWNEKVKDEDLVYFLGDFGFGNNQELEVIGRSLKGHKCIIIGNHDGRKYNPDKTIKYNPVLINHFKACGFERVEFNPIILKGCFILSHEPLYYLNENMPYFNIFGHIHSNPTYKTKTENSMCVCLDRHNYYPTEIKEYNEYIPE